MTGNDIGIDFKFEQFFVYGTIEFDIAEFDIDRISAPAEGTTPKK